MRDFKGIWIPSDIWLDERLNALEKAILMEIDSLDVDGCYASNEYLADFCKCSERKVTDAISKLIQLNFISLKSFDGRTRANTKIVRQPYESHRGRHFNGNNKKPYGRT